MPRHTLDEALLHPAIRDKVAGLHQDIVCEVQAAIAAHPVVGGLLVGGARDVQRLIDSGELQRLLT